jgi:uncharacterized protein (TIGR03000 family)
MSSTLRTIALAATLFGLTTTPALAQHHSSGGGGGNRGGGSSYHHDGGHNYHGGYGYGGYGYGGFGLSLYSPYYASPYYGYSLSPYLYANPVPNYYPPPNETLPPPSMLPASIVVLVPADAKVWFDDTLTRSTGESRTYDTPPLTPDRVYHYTVRAQWTEKGQPVELTKQIDFQGGRQTVVDFTQR